MHRVRKREMGKREKRKQKKNRKEKQKRKILFRPGMWGVNYPEHSGQQSRQQQAAGRDRDREIER